jgi:phage terminase large subunit-like protein
MSQRKPLNEVKGHLTKQEIAARLAAEKPSFTLGYPVRPQGMSLQARKLWAAYAKYLYRYRLLAFTDGDLLRQLVCAKQVGDNAEFQRINQIFKSRKKFPEPSADVVEQKVDEEDGPPKLQDFLAGVESERATFQQRLVPNQTLCCDSAGAYEWPEGDAATVARRYALDVIEGGIVAGELVRRAAQRFISDLETGHARGIFFDPIAARHIVQFADFFCGLKLLPWQVFVLANCYGFKKPSGARRYVEAWVSTAKKSGKTRLASCVALWGLIADQEKYPDCFSAATKKEQSRLVWRDAKRCVQDNPELAAYVQRWAGSLSVKDTDGSFTPLSSDEKSMDGLRPSTIIADEVAFWGDREQWDKLAKGVVSRIQPLVFAVTTAGSTKNCFAFGKFDLGEKILRGIFADDTTFVAIYSIDKEDDPMDDKCWPKANPSLGVTLQVEHLQKIRDEVLQAPSGLNAWLQYHCNIWPELTMSRAGSIPARKWDVCAGLNLIDADDPKKACTKFLMMNKETPCFGGLDVGLTSDMSCFVMLWPKAIFAEGHEPENKRVLVAQFFMPEVGLLEKEKSWGVPLSTWAREGWIDLLPGDMTDPRLIRKYILEARSLFYIREIGFDAWNAQVLCSEINESGAVECVAVPQTAKELTAPARELLTTLNSKELVHLGNPCLAWHASNVILAEDEKHGGTKPEKMSPNEKIDGIAATLNAWHRMLAAPPESVYNHRGIVALD